MLKHLCIVVISYAWVAIVPPARGQFICHVTESANFDNGTASYWYTALTCKGNLCVVAAIASPEGIGGEAHIAFLRSDDGGEHWALQDPGFPTAGWFQIQTLTSIDVIDSLDIVAFGDSLLAKTNDGGATWQQEALPTKLPVEDVSFSSTMNGILVAADTTSGTFVTSDGGDHWNAVQFTRSYAWQCHDYGNGKYRLFKYWDGNVYTTTDNWNTFDSAGPIVRDSITAKEFGFGRCSFGTGDTMMAYGQTTGFLYSPCIALTTNGGDNWSIVLDDTVNFYGSVFSLSDISRDTILATNGPNIMWSTDHGSTWKVDTLICKDSDFVPITNFGIGLTTEGNLVAAYGFGELTSSLIIGQHVTSDISSNDIRKPAVQLFPNPSSTSITLTGALAGHTFHLLDILGREVLSGNVPEDLKLTLDITSLAPGLYFVSDGVLLVRFLKK